MKHYFLYLLITLLLSVEQGYAQTPQELQSFLPQLSGWKLSSDREVFNRENLYVRINGAAPLFLENNFQEMTSMEYKKGEDYITIQAYRHATPEDAFGMYASERSSGMTYYPIGGEAQGDNTGLYFFSGCMYVKMQANNESEATGQALREIGKAFADKIDPQAKYPDLFRFFPAEVRLSYSQSYITANYIGHEFLKCVYTCDYDYYGKKIQGFIIDGKSKEGAQAILKQYLAFTKQPEALSEGPLLIRDKFNGNIPCIWHGRYIAGIFDESGEDIEPEVINYLNQVKLQ